MPLLLLLGFLLVPIVEIYVIIQVGQVIGALPTVVLLILESLLGAWIVKREGRRAWRALRQAVGSGRLPGRELSDAALILVGGTLLLTPGFVTDVVGFFFVLPITRPLARRGLGWLVARRFTGLTVGLAAGAGRPERPERRAGADGHRKGRGGPPGPSSRPSPSGRPGSGGRVVPGEIAPDAKDRRDLPPRG